MFFLDIITKIFYWNLISSDYKANDQIAVFYSYSCSAEESLQVYLGVLSYEKKIQGNPQTLEILRWTKLSLKCVTWS